MHTLVDFITHVKGIEYILSVSAITGFLLFRDVLKPAPFRTVVNTGKDDLQFIGQSGGFSGVMKSEKTWSAGWASGVDATDADKDRSDDPGAGARCLPSLRDRQFETVRYDP